MGEIKSAWELAMEKVDKLGKLSPEELRQQKEDKCRSIGQGLAEKYLSGSSLRDLKLELDRHKGEEGELVRVALASKLIDAIELGDAERLAKVVEAISELKPRAKTDCRLLESGWKGSSQSTVRPSRRRGAK